MFKSLVWKGLMFLQYYWFRMVWKATIKKRSKKRSLPKVSSEAAGHRCSSIFWNIDRKTPAMESLFNKVAVLKACSFIKRVLLLTRCFPVNIAKCLQNTSGFCQFNWVTFQYWASSNLFLTAHSQFLAMESPLKVMKNTFYFIWKALVVHKIFRCLSWIYCYVETRLIKKKRLIFKFVTSQPGKQAIAIHILSNTSSSKGNQTQSNSTNSVIEKLFPGSLLKNQHWAYLWINSLEF